MKTRSVGFLDVENMTDKNVMLYMKPNDKLELILMSLIQAGEFYL